MSQRNNSHYQARKPAWDETKRVRWVAEPADYPQSRGADTLSRRKAEEEAMKKNGKSQREQQLTFNMEVPRAFAPRAAIMFNTSSFSAFE